MSLDSPWIQVASTDDIADGEGFECDVEINGKIVGVFNLGGEYFALGECPHEEGPLAQGRVEGSEVVCPWHSARFDIRTGRCTQAPSACRTNGTITIAGGDEEQAEAIDCQAFEVRVEDDIVYIRESHA